MNVGKGDNLGIMMMKEVSWLKEQKQSTDGVLYELIRVSIGMLCRSCRSWSLLLN